MGANKREVNLRKTLWKLAYARRSVVHVLSTCEFYEKHVTSDEHPMHIPLICAICVTYARPFTDNNGVGMISQKFARYTDPQLQKTHDLLWASRMHFHAHSDATLTATDPNGTSGPLQQIQILVTRTRTARGEELSFGYGLPEIKLRGIIIPDVRTLCAEFDRRLGAEIHSTMDALFRPRMMQLKRALDQAHSDQLMFPLEFDPKA
jgi:hypothetical protein